MVTGKVVFLSFQCTRCWNKSWPNALGTSLSPGHPLPWYGKISSSRSLFLTSWVSQRLEDMVTVILGNDLFSRIYYKVSPSACGGSRSRGPSLQHWGLIPKPHCRQGVQVLKSSGPQTSILRITWKMYSNTRCWKFKRISFLTNIQLPAQGSHFPTYHVFFFCARDTTDRQEHLPPSWKQCLKNKP